MIASPAKIVRGRVGYVYPAVIAEVILQRAWDDLPEGIELVLATASIQELRDEDIAATERRWLSLAQTLIRRDVDCLVLGGAPVSNALGPAGEERFVARAEAETSVPVTTIQLAAVEQLQALGAERIGLVTPYPEHRTAKMRVYLEAQGLTVVDSVSLDEQIRLHHRIRPQPVFRAVRALRGAFDAVYLPCMQFPLPPNAQLAAIHGVPAVTAVSALCWWAGDALALPAGAGRW